MGSYSLKCYGNMSAVGNEKDKIIFRSNDTTGFSDINIPDGGWLGITLENYTQFNFPNPTFEYCIFRDMKKFWSYGLFVSSIPLLYINKCEFYHNLTDGTLISLYNNAASLTTKLKFTNCSIHDNNAGIGMYTLYNDSIIVTGSKFTIIQ